MDVGKLDRRITIERLTSGSVNGFGEPSEAWATLATVWAKRSDVSDAEKVSAGQRSSALMSRFVIRSSTVTRTVTTLDRLNYESHIWNIHGVKETSEGRNHWIEITATRESD